jgi:hypothetical protein
MEAGIGALGRLARTPASTTGKMATSPGQALNRTWSAYLTKSTKQPILTKPGTYKIYNQKRRRKYSAQLQGTIPHLPSDAYPVSAEFHPRGIKVKRSPGLFPIFPVPPPQTFTDYISTLHPWERLLFDELDMTVSPYNIITAIELREAIYSASDSSVKDNQGSFGWLLNSPDGTVILRCSGPAFGMRMKSYCAEGYRLYTFCSQPLPTNLHLFCDSKSHLDKTAI